MKKQELKNQIEIFRNETKQEIRHFLYELKKSKTVSNIQVERSSTTTTVRWMERA